ncbi:MAG: TaqI-like C-terminal specificity domain-containing protein, partial [Candidatus Lokiarchaeota archaeon]
KKTSDLKKNRSWDVFYQKGGIIDKIIKDLHESCTRIVKKESAITVTGEKILKEEEVELFIGDYFQIRSGITTIADEYFILTNEVLEKKDKILYLKIANTERLSIKQKEKLITEYNEIRNKLNKSEKEDENNFYFNEKGVLYLKITKNGKEKLKPTFNEIFNCPALLIYLRQYQKELKEKLKNYDEWTQERPYKWATIRRGGNVKLWNKSKKKNINTDLESFYDSANKIFFNYIMKTNNIFGFYEGPMVATSDMYFFHPAKRNINIYYILAYLNSKLMTFYFLNKPINIKRSKSNIENDVPVFIPRSENEKILFKSIIQTEKRVIKNFKKLEKEYRLLGFDFSLEPESPQSIKINFKTYFNKKNSKLPSLKDLSYEINDSTKIQKIDRDSFPILIDNPFNYKYFKEFQINDTILGDRLFRYKTLKIYCSKEKAHILERIIKNYDYFNQDKNTISDLMNHKFPDENLFKELANI